MFQEQDEQGERHGGADEGEIEEGEDCGGDPRRSTSPAAKKEPAHPGTSRVTGKAEEDEEVTQEGNRQTRNPLGE